MWTRARNADKYKFTKAPGYDSSLIHTSFMISVFYFPCNDGSVYGHVLLRQNSSKRAVFYNNPGHRCMLCDLLQEVVRGGCRDISQNSLRTKSLPMTSFTRCLCDLCAVVWTSCLSRSPLLSVCLSVHVQDHTILRYSVKIPC